MWWVDTVVTVHTPASTQLRAGRLSENAKAAQTPLLCGVMELGKFNKETECPAAKIQTKCRSRSMLSISLPFNIMEFEKNEWGDGIRRARNQRFRTSKFNVINMSLFGEAREST